MTKRLLFFTLTCILLASCQSYKKVPYLQDPGEAQRAVAEAKLYDARILPKDLLTIVVSCSDPELAEPFNLTVSTPVSNTQKSLTSQPALQQYLVDNRGNIDFPVLGTLHIGGLTKGEAESLIREKLKGYIKENTIVTVRMANYKISVIGEVNRPGTFTISTLMNCGSSSMLLLRRKLPKRVLRGSCKVACRVSLCVFTFMERNL